jgi:hypothetical protein
MIGLKAFVTGAASGGTALIMERKKYNYNFI